LSKDRGVLLWHREIRASVVRIPASRVRRLRHLVPAPHTPNEGPERSRQVVPARAGGQGGGKHGAHKFLLAGSGQRRKHVLHRLRRLFVGTPEKLRGPLVAQFLTLCAYDIVELEVCEESVHAN